MAWTEVDSAATSPAEAAPQYFYTAWAASTAYPVNSVRVPTQGNGLRYTATAIVGTGTSGGTEPTWPKTVGSTVVDNAGGNQITWTCTGVDNSLNGRVILDLGNLPTQHPHYKLILSYINEAKDEVQALVFDDPNVRKNALALMPRMKNWRWYDITVNNQIYLTLPSNLLYLDHVTVTRLTTAYAPASQIEYPLVEESDPAIFGQRTKTGTGWPTTFVRAGSRIELWYTPTTAYLTQVVLHGARAEDDLSVASDTLKMPLRLQKYVIALAKVITMEHAGMDGAQSERARVEDRLRKSLNISGQERRRNKIVVRVAGTPR